MNAALIAVLAVLAAQRTLAERLVAEGATTPERARALSTSEVETAGDLIEKGVIRQAPRGGFYVDEAAFAAWSQGRGIDPAAARRVTIGIGIALLALLALTLLAFFLAR